MSSPAEFQRRCSHPIVQVIEFNPVGAAVGCVLCESTLDLSDQTMAESYLPFTHTSPFGKEWDSHVLIHADLIK